MLESEDKNDNSEQIIDNSNNIKRIPTKLKIENFIFKNEVYSDYKPSYFHEAKDNENKDRKSLCFAAIMCSAFYILLIVMIITGKIYPYIFPCFLLFICACIGTWKVFPFYLFSISTINVIDYLKKRINAKVKLAENLPIPAKYIVDVTGKIDIPKEYNFVSVSKIQYFIDKSLNDFINKYYSKKIDKDDLNKKDIDLLDEDEDEDSKFMKKKIRKKQKKENYKPLNYILIKIQNLYYGGSEFFEKPYNILEDFTQLIVIDKKFFYFAKYGSIIFSILQIQWIFTLILDCMKYGDTYICIHPAKIFIGENNYLSPDITEINIHGEVIKQEDDNILEIDHERIEKIKRIYRGRVEKLKEKMEIEREKEMEERKELEKYRKKIKMEEKKRKENTETLGLWENNNYKIYVYREYNIVYLNLTVWEDNDVSFYKTIKLGDYNPKIRKEEYEGDTNLTTVFIPKGYNIKIIVTNFEYRYNIKIGNGIFDKSFRYNQEE